MSATYRDAGPVDLPAVDRLFRRSFTATFGHLYAEHDLAGFLAQFTPAAWAAELARPDLRIRVAEQDGVPVGFAKVGDPTLPVEPQGPALELRQLYLDDRARGTGVADALVRWVLDTARARGAGEVFLSVYEDNDRAIRFYRRHGWQVIGDYRFPVGTHVDRDLLMRLAL